MTNDSQPENESSSTLPMRTVARLPSQAGLHIARALHDGYDTPLFAAAPYLGHMVHPRALESTVNVEDLWIAVQAAEMELMAADAVQRIDSDGLRDLAASSGLRDRVALAALNLLRLQRLWRRHIGGGESAFGSLQTADEGRRHSLS